MSIQESFSARDRLIHEYRPYVQNIVGKLVQTMNLPIQLFDEFLSAGYMGLVEAAGRFDFSSGTHFKNFAYLRIRGAVIDSIRENADMQGRGYRHLKALNAVQALRAEAPSCEGREGSRPGDPQPIGEILDHALKGLLAFRLSLCDVEPEVFSESENQSDPEHDLLGREYSERLRSLVATLPEKERMIIEEFYFEDRSFVEIMQRHRGMSKSWVSRLHSRALDMLKVKILQEGAPVSSEVGS